jgi:hypothetical protein
VSGAPIHARRPVRIQAPPIQANARSKATTPKKVPPTKKDTAKPTEEEVKKDAVPIPDPEKKAEKKK